MTKSAQPDRQDPARQQAAPRTRRLEPLVIAALAAAILTGGAIDGAAHLTSGSSLWPFTRPGDHVSDDDKRLREQAFAAMAPLTLQAVSEEEAPRAVAGMRLSPSAEAQLRSRLAVGRTSAPGAAAKPALVATPAAARPEPAQLVWLTVWDTDVEDGDVVKIESAGYSRTVTLAKQPLTFAVPAPADGVIKVIGINDGDGGGITVGLASGASTAVFPVMSPGQVLGLRVRLD